MPTQSTAQTSLPLFQIDNLNYQGAFKIPSAEYGDSRTDFTTCSIAYNDDNGSIFMAGHRIFGTVGEFSIPEIVNSTDLSALNESVALQDFREVLDATSNGNPQAISEITGMAYIDGRLLVNAVEFYDAPADNTHTTLVIENASDIANSALNGYFSLDGAAHAAGWISPIPQEWQTSLGGTNISGNSAKYPINSRLAAGISAFSFNPSDLNGTPVGTIHTNTLLDYSLATPMYADFNSYDNPHYNVQVLNGDNSFSGHTINDADIIVGSNSLFTEESQVSYGMIIPGTRTYLTLGSSGGHNSGIGYKPTQNTGFECPGPCAYDADDYYNYYWLWDVNDLLDVKNGLKAPHDVRPYDYGEFTVPFQNDMFTQTPEFHPIFGGTFDPVNNLLYLALSDGASTGQYDKVPVILAYSFSNNVTCPVAGTVCDDGDATTINDVEDGVCGCSGTMTMTETAECELLQNPQFDNSLNGTWDYYGCDANITNGVVHISNINPSVNFWEVGFLQESENIVIQQGEDYQLSFRARAASNRTIDVIVQMGQTPYTGYFTETVALTTNMQDFNFAFTMASPTDVSTNVDFYLGGNQTDTYIDFASLVLTNCDNTVQEPVEPISCNCPVPAEPGNVVTVQNVNELQSALNQANNQNGNMTILLAPGEYILSSNLSFIGDNMADLTIKGATGNRDDVIIRGQGWNNNAVTHIFSVGADRFTVADMTIGEVFYHPIQVHSNPYDADDFTAINVRLIDAREQLFKVSGGGELFADRGGIYCCEFEFTQGIAYQFYTGGIDAHRSVDWVVHNNVFKGIRSPDGTLAEHAIHFWRLGSGTVVTANKINSCDRGIGFGLGDTPDNGHVGGLIMNNFVHTNRDVGIGVEHSPDTKIYNNTVIADNYPNSIEYRFSATTNVQITNNLVNGLIRNRNNASATTTTNYQINDLSVFTDAVNFNYHLTGSNNNIVDAGTLLNELSQDIDCEPRINTIDIGADEFYSCTPIITHSGNAETDVIYRASQKIISDAILNADIEYKAGVEVELIEGFTVLPTATFLATIENCN